MVDIVSRVIIIELMDGGEWWIPGVRRWGAGPESRMLCQYVLGYPSKRPYITIIHII